MNAITIIGENLENREFFNIIASREGLEELTQIAFHHENEESKKNALNTLLHVLNIFIEKHRGAGEKKKISEDDEDEVVHSDDEEVPESVQEKAIVANLREQIALIPDMLAKAPGYQLDAAMQSERLAPLGTYRLLLSKLVLMILKLNKEELNEELLAHKVFASIN